MTAHLRVRHSRLTIAVAVLAAGLVALGLLGRIRPPAEAWRPHPPLGAEPVGEVVAALPEAFAPLPIGLELVRLADARPAVRLRTAPRPPAPDLLLYWTPEPAAGDELPLGAHLLGPVGGPRGAVLPLPPGASGARAGRLVLYSGAHGRVVGEAALPAAEAEAR